MIADSVEFTYGIAEKLEVISIEKKSMTMVELRK